VAQEPAWRRKNEACVPQEQGKYDASRASMTQKRVRRANARPPTRRAAVGPPAWEQLELAHNARRIAHSDDARRKILGDDRTRADHSVGPYGHAR
jgi:hypothetical protein